jgi:molybdopterin molybdotransferase
MAERHAHDHDAAEGLVPLDEARERVLSRIETLRPLQLPLTDAYGCVAAEDIFSAVDLPEFASSAMDGFALRASDVAEASAADPAELKVVGHAMIGQRPEATVGWARRSRVATGAPIPAGADAVVAIENAETSDGDLVAVFGRSRRVATSALAARTCARARSCPGGSEAERRRPGLPRTPASASDGASPSRIVVLSPATS